MGRCFSTKGVPIPSAQAPNKYGERWQKEKEEMVGMKRNATRDVQQFESGRDLRAQWGQKLKLDLDENQQQWKRTIQNCHPKEVSKLLRDCVHELGNPSPAIFLFGMKNLESDGKDRQARDIYHLMKQSKIAPSIQISDYYVRLCNRLGDYPSALKVVYDLKQHSVPLNLHIYGSLIESYSGLRRLPEILEEIDKSGLEKNVILFSVCVKTCIPTGNITQATKFYEEMKSMGIQMTPQFVTAFLGVIKQFVRKGGSVRVLEDFVKSFEKEIKFGVEHYNTILSILSSQGLIDKAEKLHQKMQAEGLTDQLTRNIICDAYANVGNTAKVIELLEEDSRPERFASLMKSLNKGKELHRIPEFLEQYPQYLGTMMCTRSIFNYLYSSNKIELMDCIYEKYFNTRYLPFASDSDRINSGSDQRPVFWELHNYTVGIAVACIRFGTKYLTPRKWELIVVGKGQHQRNSRTKSLRNELLNCKHLGDVEIKEDNNPGCLQIRLR